MNVVSDTSVLLAVVLNEPEKRDIIRLTAQADAIAPEILHYEAGNALSAMAKRNRLTRDEALFALDAIKAIPVRLVTVDIHQALMLALEYRIYAYDAYFLQCARQCACPLITLDNGMKEVAHDLKIRLVE